MSRSAIKIRDVRSTVKKEMSSGRTHRSASLDMRSRGSYIPEKKRPSSEERKSGSKPFNNRWGSNVRKSSINLTDGKRKDTRPLTDKAYQKKKTCELAEFLEEMGYNPPISPSKLMSPSKKDFENIFKFLYNYFDPLYEVKKIEEEGPKILKNLGYPFNVNKSAFVYVARTNWPSLLGVLIWLMDLNKFATKVDMKHLFESSSENENIQIHRILLRYICQCHHSGIDNEEEENAIFNEIIKSSMGENLDDIIATNEEKKLLLASVMKEIDDIKLLNEKKVTLEKSIKKIEDYISKMKAHYKKKNELCEQFTEELKGKESVLNVLQEEVSKKQDLYDAQGFDGKKHLNYFEIQKKELSEKLENKRTLVQKLQDKFWESEIECRRNSEKSTADAESFKRTYIAIAEESKTLLHPLLNIKNTHAQKLCFNFHFDFPDWTVSTNKCNPKFREVHQKAFEEIVNKIKRTDEILRRINSSSIQKLNEIEMKKSELSAHLKLLSVQENMKERDLDSKKKQIKSEIATLETRCEKIAHRIKTLRSERCDLEKTHNEMSEELDYLREIRVKRESELKEYLAEQIKMFEHFERIEKLTTKLSEVYGNEISEKLEELKKL